MRSILCNIVIFLFSALQCQALSAGAPLRELDSDVADSLISIMEKRLLDPIEGIWQVAGFRSVIAIVAGGRDEYRMIAVDVDAPAVLPGTIIGFARPTAKEGTYDAGIYTKTTPDGKMVRKADFILSVDKTLRRLTMHHYYKGVAVRMWRSIPYLFGATLRMRDTRPEDIDGCLRLWPAPEHPVSIITL